MTASQGRTPTSPDTGTSHGSAPGAPDGSASTAGRRNGRALHVALYRQVLFAAGVIFLVVGCIGMVVPMMPGTVFLILAAWCFTRSSPRIEAWLLNHRYLGPSVRRWRETGAIPLVAKGFALTSFVGSFGGAWYFGAPDPVLIFLAGLFALLTLFIVTRPN